MPALSSPAFKVTAPPSFPADDAVPPEVVILPLISISPSVAPARDADRRDVLIVTAPPSAPVPPVVFISLPVSNRNEPAVSAVDISVSGSPSALAPETEKLPPLVIISALLVIETLPIALSLIDNGPPLEEIVSLTLISSEANNVSLLPVDLVLIFSRLTPSAKVIDPT